MEDRQPSPGQEGRVLITPEDGSEPFYATIAMADNPTKEGTPINKATLLSDTTAQALSLNTATGTVDQAISKTWGHANGALAAYGVTSGSATAYTLSFPGFALVDGAVVKVKLHVASGATPTLNVNSTGSRKLLRSANAPLKANTPKDTWLMFIYSSSLNAFVLQGGASGASSQRIGYDYNQVSPEVVKIIPLSLGRVF